MMFEIVKNHFDLNKNNRFVLSLLRTRGSYSITEHQFKDKKEKLKNVRLEEIKLLSIRPGEYLTPLAVVEVESWEELESEINFLHKLWVADYEEGSK